MITPLLLTLVALAIISLLITPRRGTVGGFYEGTGRHGQAPALITLVFSQVTTWIFARSLLTAAILGFYYGIGGALAYTAYYLSFFTGAVIVDQIRFRHGFGSVQAFLTDRFGPSGTRAYNVVVALRLLSEVFANLIVIGTIFGAEGSSLYLVAASVAALFTLGYSMLGGLQSSLRTDVFQMSVFLVMLAVLVFALVEAPGWSVSLLAGTAKPVTDPGWVLLMVAMLQVISYPMHDPVMMDRGFLADCRTTWKSFLHAGWLSMSCIFLFALLGVYAGTVKNPDEAMLDVLRRTLGDNTMLVLNLALIVSAVSTLDSTLSSASKLAVKDMGLASPTLRNGRIAMLAFMVGGLAFLFLDTRELYAAVAISGTASMFLTPVILFCIIGGRRVSLWAFHVAFVAAMAGAVLYYLETSNLGFMTQMLGVEHKYTKLLFICIAVLVLGNGAFAMALKPREKPVASTAG
jgi:Na+/proline symporter